MNDTDKEEELDSEGFLQRYWAKANSTWREVLRVTRKRAAEHSLAGGTDSKRSRHVSDSTTNQSITTCVEKIVYGCKGH